MFSTGVIIISKGGGAAHLFSAAGFNMKIGIDTVEIKRIAELAAKPGFLPKIFSEGEIAEFEKRGNKPNHIASAFAAKEAFSKAVGTGISGFSMTDVSLLHKHNGKPYLLLTGGAVRIADELSVSFDVSITHTDDVATAVVLAFDDMRLSHDR